MSEDHERTASLMSPAKLAQMKPRPAASPAAWLDQMASDAGHMHVRQLRELVQRLQAQAAEGTGDAALAQSLAAAAAAVPGLDLSLLEPKGWLARATGKAKGAAAEFSAQFDIIVAALGTAHQVASEWHKVQSAAAVPRDRALVEFEVEWRAIDKIIDQGARWLQDMRNQLKARQGAGGDEAQIHQDAARCELLVARLKLLRAIATAAQQVQQQAQAGAARRAALQQVVQQGLAADLKNWQSRWSPVVAAAGASGSPALGLEGPNEARQQLQQRLQQCEADLAQLAAQEQALAGALSALAGQLATAG